MKVVSKEEWINSILPGDFGLCRGKAFFSKLQNLFRKKEKEGDKPASHGFYCKGKDGMIEAEFPRITDKNKIERYLNARHSVWIWRIPTLSEEQLHIMDAVASVEVEQKEAYGSSDIIKKGMHFFFGTPMTDGKGTFCTELLSRLARSARVYFCPVNPNLCTPSLLRSWFEDKQDKWVLAASYEDGKYFVR